MMCNSDSIHRCISDLSSVINATTTRQCSKCKITTPQCYVGDFYCKIIYSNAQLVVLRRNLNVLYRTKHKQFYNRSTNNKASSEEAPHCAPMKSQLSARHPLE